jgi:hypothetical protein
MTMWTVGMESLMVKVSPSKLVGLMVTRGSYQIASAGGVFSFEVSERDSV